jgi:hypothetical protein
MRKLAGLSTILIACPLLVACAPRSAEQVIGGEVYSSAEIQAIELWLKEAPSEKLQLPASRYDELLSLLNEGEEDKSPAKWQVAGGVTIVPRDSSKPEIKVVLFEDRYYRIDFAGEKDTAYFAGSEEHTNRIISLFQEEEIKKK